MALLKGFMKYKKGIAAPKHTQGPLIFIPNSSFYKNINNQKETFDRNLSGDSISGITFSQQTYMYLQCMCTCIH